ncbi:MAG: rhomboid family intramembrane serine protease [Leptolyngbyaceae cyanobacterium SM1_1_3]|nr:rhomboid family intramembrane serine protease [Leptolyngbyaceae cyanobacterium SM1_1_3]NJN03329.1 rhomboid family intramembrane serine protease [Leptolyngbyaceae cyanobacterium RM1_1_2]NJO11297.1 rhomboid family intramembrane serine protease [Leptolyngbyaceae cyanobacterium SL_1_1]
MRRDNSRTIAQEVKAQLLILGGFVVLMWVIELTDELIFRGSLDQYGIRPRSLIGLRGILFAPFLHGNLEHLLANTIPLITLGWFVMLREISDFLWVTAIAGLSSGLGTWLIGDPVSVHIGASGLVFGYFGFLLLRGYFERSIVSVAVSLLAFMLYGSLVWGVLPNQPGISWEGHLFGFLGGILAARLLARSKK